MSVRLRSFGTVACNILSICAFLSLLLVAGCGAVGSSSTTPPPTTYTIGGTISGLTGTGLVLQDNGGNNLSISAGATTFTFTTPISTGATYSVTVLTQPSTPSQTCAVTSGSGTMGSASVTGVQVTCTTIAVTYTIGGTVSGLSGTGLVLQDNGGNNLPVSANGSFTFTTAIANGSAYNVTVLTQPVAQICVVQSGTGIVTSANITNTLISCITPPAGGTGALTPNGGTVSTPAATVTAPPGASLTQQNLTITPVAPPPGLPAPLASVGAAIDISVDNPASINEPFLITLPYDPTGIADENEMAVVHYDTTKMRYEPVAILSHDTTAHSFQIQSRVFSPFAVVTFISSLLDVSHTAGAPNNLFKPALNGWNIINFGDAFSKEGQCLGMAAYSMWYFDNPASNMPLANEFSNGGQSSSMVLVPSIAQLVAIRTMLAQSQYYAKASIVTLRTLGSGTTGLLMKMYIDVFNEPLVLLLSKSAGKGLHAGVLYGYDSANFYFYDVNILGSSEKVPFDGTNFGTYLAHFSNGTQTTFDTFTYDVQPSLGRTEDFDALTTEALLGFPTSSLISVTSPTPNQQITTPTAQLSGTQSISPSAQVIAYANDAPQGIQNPGDGSFSGTLPIGNGENTIVLAAGVNIFQQSDWHTNGSTLIFDVTGTVGPITLNPQTGYQGQQNLSVSITGQNTNFVQGTTTASFGAGITVASLTVSSATSATAVLNIDPTAAVGASTVTVTTGTEVDTLTNGFSVTAPTGATYTYVGNGFTTYVCAFPYCSLVGGSITASFTFATPIPPNSTRKVSQTNQPLSWAFSDGISTISSSQPQCPALPVVCGGATYLGFLPPHTSSFLSTDANGAINAWYIWATSATLATSGNAMSTDGEPSSQADQSDAWTGQQHVGGFNSASPGTWTIH